MNINICIFFLLLRVFLVCSSFSALKAAKIKITHIYVFPRESNFIFAYMIRFKHNSDIFVCPI